MTKIRLARAGSKFQPHYRVIVTDSRNRRDGRFIESLGYYNPLTHPSTVKIDQERANYWIGVGAQPTNTVISLLSRAGVTHTFEVRRKPRKAAEAATTETPAEIAPTKIDTAAEPADDTAPATDDAA